MYYNSTNSRSADVPAPDTQTQYNYGDLTIKSVSVVDKVCVLGQKCEDENETGLETIQFGAITTISKLNYRFDGLFGLAPQANGMAPNYIENLSA